MNPFFNYPYLINYISLKKLYMEHELIYTEKPNFIEITCTQGHYITNWNKEDINEFADATLMICPLGFDVSGYYCITEEEHNMYLNQQIEAFKAKEAEEQNKRNL